MAEKIYKRAIFDEVSRYFLTDDIIVLHGARQVGKTHILYLVENYLKNNNRKVYYIDLEDSRFVKILDAGVDEFIKHLEEEGFDIENLEKQNKIFVLIDEIQYLKNPSSFLKLAADHWKNIKLIVSGSSSFAIKSKFKDSLVGRAVNFEIFPLSFAEFLEFKEYKITAELLKERKLTGKKYDEIKALFKEYVLYGGYPKIVLTGDLELKEKYLQQIIDTYIKKDIGDLANIKEIGKFNKLVETLSSQSGRLLDVAELANTCRLAKPTVENYLFILENTYIIKLLRPYYKNIRSELFKTPKIFFYDSGIMQMLWLKQLQKEILGGVFETAIFSELVKKYGKDDLFYWRTADKKEIDFIVKKGNEILPIEAKLSFRHFNKTAVSYFCDKYKISGYKVAAIEGELTDASFHYPWSL
ncbi:MAG: Uncharacterized protein Athens101410_583 [Parcubacteria group bacterium Athens1014_10]|nr:MAG: Uncharacterized protein Athens101410_583 [Parcubacteria group bacterium Athens1014_10]TSD04644.1 MAG: Uncharacterized protein Athens071412_711 [Parcubacteria group bacterium Athens0714_12]